MNEQDSGGFGIGDALASLALILGGGAAGRKMAGRNAIPSKAELSDLYKTLYNKAPTKADIKDLEKRVKGVFNSNMTSLNSAQTAQPFSRVGIPNQLNIPGVQAGLAAPVGRNAQQRAARRVMDYTDLPKPMHKGTTSSGPVSLSPTAPAMGIGGLTDPALFKKGGKVVPSIKSDLLNPF